MGGCSSKPQTAECNEGLLFHTALKTSDSSPHQTLESLFNQHGRDGEALLEDAQTLHELLLHAVDSKELPDFENQSARNTEANLQTRASQPDLSFPCKLNSPVSVNSHAAERNASKCMEGSLPISNEETGAKMPNLTEGNEEKGGASNLEASQSGLAEVTKEKCSNLELMLLALPEDNAANCIKVEGFMSNVAEANQANAEKLEGFVSNLTEVKRAEECPKLTVALSNSAEENAIKLESPESLNLEPKSDFLKTPESTSSECAEYETRGHNLGPKSDELKILIKASDAMESKEADVQGLNELSMTGEIERELQDAIAMETAKTPKQDDNAMPRVKNQNALQGAETEDQLEKAIEGQETENAVDGKNTEMQCEKALEIEKDKISHQGEKAEVQNEKEELQNQKAMEGELPKAQFESGGMSWVQGEKAMEDNKLQPKTEKAMECEKVGLQDEKSNGEDEKTGVQNERNLDGDIQMGNVHDAEEKESQEEEKTGVHDDETGVQTKKSGLEDEVQHEERAEDEKAMENVSLLHVKGEDEEAKEDLPSSPLNRSFAFTSDRTHAMDSCFEPLTGSEQSIVAIHCGPIEAVGLEDIEKLEFEQKKTERIESSNEAVAAVAGGDVAKPCDNFKALQDGQSQPTKDDSDEKVKMEVSDEEDGFVHKDHHAEKLQCGHIQMPMQELDLITSKAEESHMQAHDESVLSSFPESSVQENLSSPTVVEIDVEKRVADISSSSLSAAENTFIECVESKPRIKTSGEVVDDANEMEDSKQCGEKGEGLKASEELENLESATR